MASSFAHNSQKLLLTWWELARSKCPGHWPIFNRDSNLAAIQPPIYKQRTIAIGGYSILVQFDDRKYWAKQGLTTNMHVLWMGLVRSASSTLESRFEITLLHFVVLSVGTSYFRADALWGMHVEIRSSIRRLRRVARAHKPKSSHTLESMCEWVPVHSAVKCL